MASVFLQSLPVAVCGVDRAGRVVCTNDALVALLGRRPSSGSDSWEALGLQHPDGRAIPWEESAPAQAIATRGPARADVLAVLPDGKRLRLQALASPLPDGSGAVTVLLDGQDGAGAARDDPGDTATEVNLARLAAIVSSSEDAIVSKTLGGIVTSWNAGAERIFGYAPEEMVGQPIGRIIPPELHAEEEDILARLRRGERVEHFDTERVGKDGRRVFASVTISPIRNRAGEIVGASKVARDITERKRAEEMQRLLVGELNHRVKNTLATIQAIAQQSLRLEPSPSRFVAGFTGRLQALARAHDILVHGDMQRGELGDLVREQVELGSRDGRISVSGPKVVLDARTTLQMALVLHELATNARKYGGLSTPGGRLLVAWTTEGTGAASELVLDWRESGVVRHGAPAAPGFGTVLIERSLLANEGRTELRHLADGLSCRIRLPLPGAVPALSDGGRGAPVAPPVATAEEPRPLAGLRILVVEDEPLIAMDIEERLLAAGGEIIGPAANLESARRLIAETAPDAALLDANLAGEQVDDLAVELRRRGIPFAFATGFGRASLPAAFHDVPILGKPFGSEQLVEMVRSLLAARSGADDGPELSVQPQPRI
jgi:PAS domain S-box-containing protein